MSFNSAMIPLRICVELSAEAIKADFAARWPHMSKPVSLPASEDQIAFCVGDYDVVIANMQAPIPWAELEPLCEASLLWQDATTALRDHATHTIVAVRTGKGPIEQSRFLTQVCASVLTTCEQAIGVFWLNATLLVPPEFFLFCATEVMPESLPVHIWVDCQVGLDNNGKNIGYTVGMAALGHLDIEAVNVPESLEDLRDRLYLIVSYILENGPIIKDGDTIGKDSLERVHVIYRKSVLSRDRGKVMCLEYSLPRNKRRRWFGGK